MRLGKALLLVAIAVSLTAYAFDCAGMTTPDEAMQCCNSMACAPHGHQGQDCCKTMPSMHAPFVQNASMHGAGFSPVAWSMTVVARQPIDQKFSAHAGQAHCHAPPFVNSPLPQPLRI